MINILRPYPKENPIVRLNICYWGGHRLIKIIERAYHHLICHGGPEDSRPTLWRQRMSCSDLEVEHLYELIRGVSNSCRKAHVS